MKVLIVGCGRMGAGLARVLSQRGVAVTIVDRDPAALTPLMAGFGGRTVIGDGLDRAVLVEAGIEQADGLATVTTSDEVNLVVARLARQVFRVPRVVARLHDPRMADIYRRLGVPTISTVAWGIQRLTELLRYSELDALVSLADGAVEVVEIDLPPLLVGRPVSAVTIPGEAHVVAINRRGRPLLPAPNALFQPDDRLYLVVLTSAIDRLKTVLGLP